MDLFAAVDETKDGEYLAFVVCDNHALERNISTLPSGFTHIANRFYSRNFKKQIINNLDLSGNAFALCAKFDIPMVNLMLEKADLGRQPYKKIQQRISYRIVSSLNKMFSKFLNDRGMHIRQLKFESDNDIVKNFIRDGALTPVKPSNAHKIADCLAYANLQKWEVRGNVQEWGEDFRDEFILKIRSDFRL